MKHSHERHKRKKRRITVASLIALGIALTAVYLHLEVLVKGCEFAVMTHTIFELFWFE